MNEERSESGGAGFSNGEPEEEILRRAIGFYGAASQKQVAIEELSELTKELCKDLRGTPDRSHITEEMADVQIMLNQLELLYGNGTELRACRAAKLERLTRRMDAR